MNLYQSKLKSKYEEINTIGDLKLVRQNTQLFAAKSRQDLKKPQKWKAVYGSVTLKTGEETVTMDAKVLANQYQETTLIASICDDRFNTWMVK